MQCFKQGKVIQSVFLEPNILDIHANLCDHAIIPAIKRPQKVVFWNSNLNHLRILKAFSFKHLKIISLAGFADVARQRPSVSNVRV